MKKITFLLVAAFLFLMTSPVVAQDMAAGLKEALAVGTGNAVQMLSKSNGYFGDAAVKILMPENMQKAAEVLKKAGYQKDVDEFVLSMNRAAEQAAPKARPIFEDAVKKMTFDDAQKIIKGNNTAATDYFKAKTSPQLTDAFKPVVSDSMNQVGATRSYKELTDRYNSMVPFGKMDSFDLDSYVTKKSLDGMFYKVGQEEAKIRTNPAARTTDLLKKVFGK
jgi:transcriptional regulator with PAS, ATPase and Fis domain